MTFSLTPQQLDLFERRGVVHLPGFYSAETIQVMAVALWTDMERRFGYQRDDPRTWKGPHPGQFQALKKSGAFSLLRSPQMCELADAMLGAWDDPAHWGGPLVTFPSPTPAMRRPPWHLDIGGTKRLAPLPTLRIFTFLERSPPGGGGTLYVASSHQLAIEMEREVGRKVRSAEVRMHLSQQHPWFAHLLKAGYGELPALAGTAVEIGGQTVSLEQMAGEPGDLIIMHPAILHGGAHNALDRPRLMLTEWIMRRA